MHKTYHVIFFFLFSLSLLFYPGDSFYVQKFSFYRTLFETTPTRISYALKPVPIVKNPFFKPALTAEGIYLVDLESFTPVLKQNEHTRLLPASTTKIISSLVAYDLYAMDDVLTVKRVVEEGQTMGLVGGERIAVENILYGLLVHSGNDAAYVLADNDPDGYDNFVYLMNQKANSLEMKNSYFKNPAGLDAPGQYTTPFDLALAGRQFLKNKTIARIVSTKSITVSDEDFMYFHRLENVNKLLGEIPGVGGLKTGFTEDAGENLISFYKHAGHRFLIVILKSQDRFADTKNIIEWIKTNIEHISV